MRAPGGVVRERSTSISATSAPRDAQRAEHGVEVLARWQPAAGEDEKHRQPAEPPSGVGDQLEAGRVRQVQVLEGQQHRGPARCPGQELHHGLAQPDPLELGIGAGSRRRHRCRPLPEPAPGRSWPGRRSRRRRRRSAGQAHEIAQRVGPDGERRMRGPGPPPWSGDQGGVRGRPPRRGLQFLDQPGLADAALAFKQHGSAGAAPRRPPGLDQLGEVLVPADEARGRLDRVLRRR